MLFTGTRVIVEVPDSEQYHGKMEGLCGNMDGQPEEQDPLFTTWDEYGNVQAQAQCTGATSPMPDPCKAVSRFDNLSVFLISQETDMLRAIMRQTGNDLYWLV